MKLLQLTYNISWSAHFANFQVAGPRPSAITGLLPLFREIAHFLPIVKHDIDYISKVTVHINPEQVPVITMDEPLYAIARKVQ